jgi:hypothetical protein
MAHRCTILLLLLGVAVAGCKKDEPTSWDTDIASPIGYGRFNLEDLLEDSLLLTNPDGSLGLAYDQEILDIRIDSIVDIPSDTVENAWSLPVSLNVPPNTLIFTQEDEFELANDAASLSAATLQSGQLNLFITNEIASELILEYRIPEAIRDGAPLLIEIAVPGSTDGQPGSVELVIDIAGYELNLTGENGNAFNTLLTTTRIKTANNAEPTAVSANEEVTLKVVYNALTISEAMGYFNTTQTELNGTETTFDEISGIYESILMLESATAKLRFINGFGADLRAIISNLSISNSFTGTAANLDNNILNTPINISRAIRIGDVLFPSERTIIFNTNNSNITDFIEVLGDSLQFEGLAILNPLGNVSNYNDFITDESRLKAELSLEIPLNFSISNLVLRDTIELNWDDLENFPSEMDLYIRFENQFPIQLETEISAIDPIGNVLLNLNDYLVGESSVISGSIEPSPAITVFKYELGANAIDNLRMASDLVVTMDTETSGYPDLVLIRAEQGIDIQVSVKAKLRIE